MCEHDNKILRGYLWITPDNFLNIYWIKICNICYYITKCVPCVKGITDNEIYIFLKLVKSLEFNNLYNEIKKTVNADEYYEFLEEIRYYNFKLK